MKTTLFSLSATVLLILSCTNSVNAQFFDQNPKVLDTANLLVTYSLLWREDTLNPDFQRQEDMYLLIGSNTSQFVSKNYLLGSLLGRKMEKEGKLDEFLHLPSDQKYRARFLYSIYKSRKNGTMIYNGYIMPTHFEYEENLNIFKWDLGSDTIRILGFSVNQAFTNYGGRKWVVWYTTEIPINDGPYKFCGLPGLILKASDTKDDYIFEAVSIERLKEPMAIELSERDLVHTSREQYLKSEQNLIYDIVNRAKEAGALSEIQQKAAQNMQRKNNPIERN